VPEHTDLMDEVDRLDLDAALERTYARHDELVVARAHRRRRVLGAGLAVAAVALAAVLVPVLGGDEEPGTISDGVAGQATLPPPDPATPSGPEAEAGPATVEVRPVAVIDATPVAPTSVELTFACAGVGDMVETVGWAWSDPTSPSGGTLWVDAAVSGESTPACAPGDPGASTIIELDRPFVAGTSVEAHSLR
jgi:hypothetical protein